jgi:hypothetical protein
LVCYSISLNFEANAFFLLVLSFKLVYVKANELNWIDEIQPK